MKYVKAVFHNGVTGNEKQKIFRFKDDVKDVDINKKCHDYLIDFIYDEMFGDRLDVEDYELELWAEKFFGEWEVIKDDKQQYKVYIDKASEYLFREETVVTRDKLFDLFDELRTKYNQNSFIINFDAWNKKDEIQIMIYDDYVE